MGEILIIIELKRGIINISAVNEQKRKISGYWKEWNNIKSELEKLKEKLGRFPTFNYI